jgi:hypothetical protein
MDVHGVRVNARVGGESVGERTISVSQWFSYKCGSIVDSAFAGVLLPVCEPLLVQENANLALISVCGFGQLPELSCKEARVPEEHSTRIDQKTTRKKGALFKGSGVASAWLAVCRLFSQRDNRRRITSSVLPRLPKRAHWQPCLGCVVWRTQLRVAFCLTPTAQSLATPFCFTPTTQGLANPFCLTPTPTTQGLATPSCASRLQQQGQRFAPSSRRGRALPTVWGTTLKILYQHTFWQPHIDRKGYQVCPLRLLQHRQWQKNQALCGQQQ